jgi:hypothetical protein
LESKEQIKQQNKTLMKFTTNDQLKYKLLLSYAKISTGHETAKFFFYIVDEGCFSGPFCKVREQCITTLIGTQEYSAFLDHRTFLLQNT